MPPYYQEVDKSNELVPIVLVGKRRPASKIWQSNNISTALTPQDNAESGADESPKCNISMGQFQECPKVRSLMDELLSEICTKMNRGLLVDLTSQDSSRSRNSRESISSMNWQSKDVKRLREEKKKLERLIADEGNELVKHLKRKNYLLSKREVHFNIITACIQAMSSKTREDTKMKFSLSPKGETGFSQWLDAMKMVAQLPGGMPPEFRTKLWLQLSEKHLNDQNVDWEKAEAVIFNESTNPDDEELGVQIVKDLHRTGCSLFCGEQEHNQALLKRVLLAYARWNKTVGYCQGFNMLAALILQVMEKKEKDAVKVMIYLIEGLLPESYFANNLRGLSVDMAVFRDLLRLRLPKLSKHLEALQNDTNAVNVYEPPLTNVFTMQWFLTLFSNCLPQLTVLRVWDLVFLYGNEILLRTALAIWEVLQDRIITVESADEFYSIMGVVTREMLEFGLMDANALVKKIAMVDPFPNELHELREKYLYNISPWTQSVQSAARKGIKLFYSDPDDQDDTEDDEKIAVATAYGVLRRRESTGKELQLSGPTLDLNVLKQQYLKLRERQRQAHVIITAACSSSIPRNISSAPSVSVNHLLLGKSALVNKGRRIGPPEGSIPPPAVLKKEIRQGNESKAVKSDAKVTKQIKGNKLSNDTIKYKKNDRNEEVNAPVNTYQKSAARNLEEKSEKSLKNTKNKWNSFTSDSSSTSTELCDEESSREDASDYEVPSDNYLGSAPSVPVHVIPDSPVPVLTESPLTSSEKFANNPGCDNDNFSNAKTLAIQLVNEIEDKVKSSPKFQGKNGGNEFSQSCESDLEPDQKKQIKQLDNTVDISLDVVEKTIVPDNFIKCEPEVPIKKNVIKNFNVAEILGEVEEDKQRETKKIDLGLSIMRENQDMLHKFSHTKEKKEEKSRSVHYEKDEEVDEEVGGGKGKGVGSFECKNTSKEKTGAKELEEEFRNLFQHNEEEAEEEESPNKFIKPETPESFLPPQSDLVEKAISPIVSADFAILKAEKVNKEVNTEITFGVEEVEISASKTRMCLNGESKPVASNESLKNEETRSPGEKSKTYRQLFETFGRKDEIKTKIEVSKSDWELKMRKIAELEATARETLNEIEARSYCRKSLHRSLDRNTKRSFLDAEVRERETSPCRLSALTMDKDTAGRGRREEKISSSSFDEITSRTEKLLGYSDSKSFLCDSTALESKDCIPRFKSQNKGDFDDLLEFPDSSHFKSSPTSPERRIRGAFVHQLGTKDHSSSLAEVSRGSTYLDVDYSWTRPKNIESSTCESDKNQFFRKEATTEREIYSCSKNSKFNPFPTKSFARPRDVSSKLGLYPTTRENR